MSDHGERTPNIAVFCDYENVAIGARESGFGAFDAGMVLARMLEKGKVLVKRAYADWHRYCDDRRPLHEAGFELVEVPHVSFSGKNSADIRLVVDALDLCHTKAHIDLFAIISGDSDFSPLVGKLRENGAGVVGFGVKHSTSDLLVESCDEFVYYDDLCRESRRTGGDARHQALALVHDTAEALLNDRGSPVWGSMVKQAIKRKRPNFSESNVGFRNFNALLEHARDRGDVDIRKDGRSGGYQILQVA